MPAFSTHYIFAKELLPWLKDNTDIKISDGMVYLGTQGADIFFFHRVFPWMLGKSLRKIGSSLHRSKPSEILESMRDYASSTDNKDLALSYICGFIMHYALDRVCHPYVYSLQNKITHGSRFSNSHTVHNKIEFAMDSLLIKNRLKIDNPLHFNTADTIVLSEKEIHEAGLLLQSVIKSVIGKDICDAATAIRDTEYIQSISFDSHGIKRVIISILDIPIALATKGYKLSSMLKPKDLEKAKKYANIEKAVWQSPWSSGKRNESFEELFEIALLEARQMILSFLNGDDCREITHNISFLTGVEVK